MEKLLAIINEIRDEKGEEKLTFLDTDINLREDINFDSFDLAVLTAKIEDEFDIDIFEDGFVSTIGEIINKLEKK